MKKTTKLKYVLLWVISIGIFACSKDNSGPAGELSVKFANESGEFKIKRGDSVMLTALVENAEQPIYSWRLDGKIISTDLNCQFKEEGIGEYFVTFRVDAENGSVEKQVKVTVVDKLLPQINMPAEMVAYAGEDKVITADVLYADSAAYVWRLDGVIVSESKTYVHHQTSLGAQTLSLKVTNEDGVDMQVFSITTLPKPVPELFFDDGRYRIASNVSELRKMTVPLGRSLVLAPVICNISHPQSYVWKVDGVTQTATTEYFTFAPIAKGTYSITVTEQSTQAQATVQVTCTEQEGTYFRSITANSKATASTIYDYVPAPGQFVNYQIGSTKTQAMNDAQTWLNSNNTSGYLHIGAYGGYWISGFDHSVSNVANKPDLMINGNAFSGWSEPGIVWVMQDANGNGLPDDTWYELKGSQTGNPETKQRYAITYYKPKKAGANVLWTDNMGRTNSVDYNSYHSQAYYFPMFIAEEYYTLVGTCLESGVFSQGGIVYARDLPWGYVDNYNSDAAHTRNYFWIEDAINVDGTPANLTHIDFVKVHTGMAGKGAAVGEISTEACVPADLNFTK